MLSPLDMAAQLRDRYGDESVATTPDDDQPNVEVPGLGELNRVRGHRIVDVATAIGTNGQLAAGATAIIQAPYAPDGWLIAIPNIANVEVEVTLAADVSSFPNARLGPGGSCLLPGRDVSLGLKNIGSAAVYPVVNALKNVGDLRWYIDPGTGTMTK